MKNNYFWLVAIISIIVLYKFDFLEFSKKSNLNKFYAKELRSACSAELDPNTQKWGEKELEKIELTMLQDGYDRAQVNSMRNDAYDKAYKQRDALIALKHR
jgi:hypothetical protein